MTEKQKKAELEKIATISQKGNYLQVVLQHAVEQGLIYEIWAEGPNFQKVLTPVKLNPLDKKYKKPTTGQILIGKYIQGNSEKVFRVISDEILTALYRDMMPKKGEVDYVQSKDWARYALADLDVLVRNSWTVTMESERYFQTERDVEQYKQRMSDAGAKYVNVCMNQPRPRGAKWGINYNVYALPEAMDEQFISTYLMRRRQATEIYDFGHRGGYSYRHPQKATWA